MRAGCSNLVGQQTEPTCQRTPFVKGYLGISDTVCSINFQMRADSMTEPDILSSKIRELMDWQTVAWRRIADPSITLFERREIRNHLKESDAELRRCLAMVSERHRFRMRGPVEMRDSLAELKLRLLA
jgi:hypothetical protein